MEISAFTIENDSIYDAELKISKYLTEIYFKKPYEPNLASTRPSTEEIKKYNILKKEYDSNLKLYKDNQAFYMSEKSRVYSLLTIKLKEDSGLNTIPEQYRDKVYAYAYEQGHSSGMSEVSIYLERLLQIFD
jgi:hypothetical protein